MPCRLHVTAELAGTVSLPSSSLALDAILAYAVAMRDQLPPISEQMASGTFTRVKIPIVQAPGREFHFASFAEPVFDEHERRYIHRRFPLAEAIRFTDIASVNPSTGPEKSYRVPYTTSFLQGDRLQWWCVGDADEIRSLLSLIHFLGAHRKCGSGRVKQWTVEPCESWGPGFPVVRDGKPLRPLPLDWPGLVAPSAAYIPLTYPYWRKADAVLCAVG